MTEPAEFRIALGLEYDGTAYSGLQIQSNAPSIQEILNTALSEVADEAVTTVTAGRTDTGVHASAQVMHFDTRVARTARSWIMGANSNLPADVNVLWVKRVPESFHARFSALSRSYEYRILNRPVRSALLRDRRWWVYESLDVERMSMAAKGLEGEHDFSSFRASGCQAHTPVRKLQHIAVTRNADEILVACRANAFLQHMVRNIVGSLVAVGRGEQTAEWLSEVLLARDRKLSGVTAPAQGLCLVGVEYPPEFGVPAETGSGL
ncbi:MAG: tRNA pseudouridine(38-40) synthase TruA [Gammaproteobacteria bacterium]